MGRRHAPRRTTSLAGHGDVRTWATVAGGGPVAAPVSRVSPRAAARAARRRASHAPGPVHARGRGGLPGLLVRSALLGVAAGSRASLGVAAPVLSDPRRGGLTRSAAFLGVVGELVGDKRTPVSRLDPPSPQGRAASAALGGAALARRAGRAVWLPAATAALFSVVGTWGGAAWRAGSAEHGPDLPAALVEDAVAVTLAALACRGSARPVRG